VQPGAELGPGTADDDVAAAHHVAPVRDLQCQPYVLLDQDDRAALVGGRPDGSQQPAHHQRGQPHGQLVDQQDPRLAGQGPGQRQHLLLTAGQQAAADVQPLTQLGEQRQGSRDADTADPEVLGRRHPHEDGLLLGDEADPLAGPPEQRVGGVLPVQPDLTAHRRQLPGHDEQAGRLAGPVGTQQRDHFTRVDLDVQAVHDGLRAIASRDPPALQNGRRGQSW
jgi:hypothetical protein